MKQIRNILPKSPEELPNLLSCPLLWLHEQRSGAISLQFFNKSLARQGQYSSRCFGSSVSSGLGNFISNVVLCSLSFPSYKLPELSSFALWKLGDLGCCVVDFATHSLSFVHWSSHHDLPFPELWPWHWNSQCFGTKISTADVQQRGLQALPVLHE